MKLNFLLFTFLVLGFSSALASQGFPGFGPVGLQRSFTVQTKAVLLSEESEEIGIEVNNGTFPSASEKPEPFEVVKDLNPREKVLQTTGSLLRSEPEQSCNEDKSQPRTGAAEEPQQASDVWLLSLVSAATMLPFLSPVTALTLDFL